MTFPIAAPIAASPMTARQRFRAVMNFQPFDRLPMIEWASWWDQTLARWRGEGLPAGLDRYELYRYFGLDLYLQDWISPRRPTCPAPAGHGQPLILDEAGYERLRPHLFPRPAIDAARWRERFALQASGEAVLWFTLEGFFWFPRTLLGIENHLYAFHDAPALMHRINQDLVDWQLGVLDEIFALGTPDFMTFAEDLSYNHGPMISEPQYREFIHPYYCQVVPRLRERGVWAIVDSDGDVARAAPWFAASGLDGVLPLERQAGVDLARLRQAHPRLRFIGHFDKMVMANGETALRAEFSRLLALAARGGFIPSVDHQTPPGVSLGEYQLYLRLLREYAATAGQLSQAAAGTIA